MRLNKELAESFNEFCKTFRLQQGRAHAENGNWVEAKPYSTYIGAVDARLGMKVRIFLNLPSGAVSALTNVYSQKELAAFIEGALQVKSNAFSKEINRYRRAYK